MEHEKEKVMLLAENLLGFVDFVRKHDSHNFLSDPEYQFRLKNLVEEYKLHLLASEILRINQFTREKKQTNILISRVKKAIESIDEFVENNVDRLFIFSARLYTLKAILRTILLEETN